jgi:gluconolactonase
MPGEKPLAITVIDEHLIELVGPEAQPERIATGYAFTEGPLWHPVEEHLTFSDVNGGVMYRWSEADGTSVFRRPSQGANGNTWDREGRLVTCEHFGRRVSRTNPDGTLEAIALSYDGKLLNSPNDVICIGDGNLIFSDPPYGLRRPDGSFGAQDLAFNGVYRVSAHDGSIRLLADDFDRPNGLVITDDGRRLFVADTARQHVRSFDVDADGGVTGGEVFVELRHGDAAGRPDGMKLDERGNLYIAANTQEGIWVYSPAGDLLGLIGLPETPANLAWGGDGWTTMFVTAQSSVYRLPMRVAGQPSWRA